MTSANGRDAEGAHQPVGIRQPRQGFGVLGIERDRPLEARDRLRQEPAALDLQRAAPQQQLVGLEVLGAAARAAPVRLGVHRPAQPRGDGVGDLVLHREHVGHLAVVALRPELVAVGGVDELRGDAQPRAGSGERCPRARWSRRASRRPARRSSRRPLNAKHEVRAATRRPSTCASAFRISSVTPSAKYSSSAPLRFSNGSTAIDFSRPAAAFPSARGDVGQLEPHVADVARPRVGVLAQAAAQDLAHPRRRARRQRRPVGLALEDARDQIRRGLAGERPGARSRHSNSTQPNDQTSLRRSTGLPRACSGLM